MSYTIIWVLQRGATAEDMGDVCLRKVHSVLLGRKMFRMQFDTKCSLTHITQNSIQT